MFKVEKDTNLNGVCRLCLSKKGSGELLEIFSENKESKENSISHLLFKLFQIKVMHL